MLLTRPCQDASGRHVKHDQKINDDFYEGFPFKSFHYYPITQQLHLKCLCFQNICLAFNRF